MIIIHFLEVNHNVFVLFSYSKGSVQNIPEGVSRKLSVYIFVLLPEMNIEEVPGVIVVCSQEDPHSCDASHLASCTDTLRPLLQSWDLRNPSALCN